MTKQLVIIPVYDEASTMKQIVTEVCKYHKQELLIIDDGSTDGSTATIEKLDCPQVSLIAHETNQGYGATLIDGFGYARDNKYDYALTIDADWQHEPRYIPEFFVQAQKYDIVSGSRYLNSSKKESAAPEDRIAINHKITHEINAITGYQLTDAFCGFKAYKISSLTKLYLSEPGYGFPLQLWIQAFCHGLAVREIAVPRIYLNFCRSFGPDLNDPNIRLKYYEKIIKQEVQKCQHTP